MKPLEIAGQRFGRLVVQKRSGTKQHRGRNYASMWEVLCDCGNTKKVIGSNLLSGVIQSCGCLRKEKNGRRLPFGVASRNIVFSGYKKNAKVRNLQWEISLIDFEVLVQQPCFYCGREPSNKSTRSTGVFQYNGIDRVDNYKGYSLENVVPCCWICNSMKNVLSKNEFLTHIENILEYQIAKNLSVGAV